MSISNYNFTLEEQTELDNFPIGSISTILPQSRLLLRQPIAKKWTMRYNY